MKLLVVDTARDALFMALVEDGRTVARRTSSGRAARRQDERLFPVLRGLLARAGWGLKDLEAVAAVSGPGRFTGIRIGMTFASMLARSLSCRALGLSRFDAVASGLGKDVEGPVCVVLHAQQGPEEEFFFQVFRRRRRGWEPDGEPRWAKAADLAAAVGEARRFYGPAAEQAARACGLPGDRVLPGGREDAAALTACASARAETSRRASEKGGRDSPMRPLYLKPWRGQKQTPANHDRS